MISLSYAAEPHFQLGYQVCPEKSKFLLYLEAIFSRKAEPGRNKPI
jgi:hypothetical protein